MKDCLGFG